jgi:hypothetical protein
MTNIKFNYLYRDGSNYKSWGEVVFANPENLVADEVGKRLVDAFLPDQLFVASQVSIPEKFLFLDGELSEYDHCYHEFDCVEICEESPTDSLGRSVTDFLHEVEIVAKQGWEAFDIFDRA